MQTHEPDSSIHDCVQNNPEISLHVQLLYRCPVSSCFVPNCVYVPAAECAAVWSSHSLLKTRKSFLIHCTYFEVFALL
jgi:hypothetical protein